MFVALAGTLAGTLAAAGPAAAQTSDLSVEVGGSRVLPPAGVEGDAAAFVVAGLRGSRYDLFGTGAYASLLLGRALDAATGGDFVSGEVGGAAWRSLGRSWSTGVEARALAFRVQDPFEYEAGAVEGSVMLRYRGEILSAKLAGTAGAGRSRMTVSTVVQRMRHTATVDEVLEDDLWRAGWSLEVLAGSGPVAAGAAVGIHRSAGGTYRTGGLRGVAAGRAGAVEVRLDAWRVPDGSEKTGSIAFYIPWGGWSARGMAGRPEPDPLLLAEPGRGAGGVLVGRRIAGSGPPRTARPLHEVLHERYDGARVRITVEAPEGAAKVEVLGDFTLWEPVAMAAARGRRWTLEMDVPAGTHHFGFLVNGSWYLPDDAPDAVPDEWGRKSATLVIEGAGEP